MNGEQTIAELIPLACRGVTMVTSVRDDHVAYEVWVGPCPLAGDRSEARRVWGRTVGLGRVRSFRAGGPAFKLAALAQERVARAYVDAAKGVQ